MQIFLPRITEATSSLPVLMPVIQKQLQPKARHIFKRDFDEFVFIWPKAGHIFRKFIRMFSKKCVITIEDGFIRSLRNGENDPFVAITADCVGTHIDATKPSLFEIELNDAAFHLLAEEYFLAKQAIEYIISKHISKYNASIDIPLNYFNSSSLKVLIVDQSVSDLSIKVGLAKHIKIDDLIKQARIDYPDAQIVVKPHPDNIMNGKIGHLKLDNPNLIILDRDYHPISLLKQIDVVYVMTSQLGFEALLLGKKVVCFGLPFYAGWGVTQDKQFCKRRTQKRSVLDIFIIAYLRNSYYYDPISRTQTDILFALEYLNNKRINYLKEQSLS